MQGCQWPFPWHSWWLMFVSSVDLREGVSSSISSLLSELLLSLWLWVIVNNCSTKCSILRQTHAIGHKKSENRDLCGCSWYRSSWRSWRSEFVPARRLRPFFPSQPTEFRLAGGLYTGLQLGQFKKSRQTETVWSALVVNPLANLICRIGFDVSIICFSYQLCWVMDPLLHPWTKRGLRSLQWQWGGAVIPCRDKQLHSTEDNPIQVCPSVRVTTTAHISQSVMGNRKAFSILVSHINIAST